MAAVEQEAIAAYLNSLGTEVGGPFRKILVFEALTSTVDSYFSSTAPPSQQVGSRLPKASSAVVDSFLRLAAIQVPTELPRRLLRPEIRWQVAKESALARIFAQRSLGASWDSFYKTYPDAAGLASVSRVGIDSASTQALFYFSLTSGGMRGRGWLVLMHRPYGVWRQLAVEELWVS